ncbi:MAG TPA: IMP dehydrogenase, partial [Candidatus Paceibacterota bacterium]
AGASTIMSGYLLAGTDEAPGEKIIEGAAEFKLYRGMASRGVVVLNDGFYRTPEGDSGKVTYKGGVSSILNDLSSGLRSSMSYLGAKNLKEFHKNAEFIKVSSHTLRESNSRI